MSTGNYFNYKANISQNSHNVTHITIIRTVLVTLYLYDAMPYIAIDSEMPGAIQNHAYEM